MMSSSTKKCSVFAQFLRITVVIILCATICLLYSCVTNRSDQKPEQSEVTETTIPVSPKPNRMFNLDFLIVGTLNDIRFEELEWASLTVEYWLFNPDRSYSPGRVITISDKETIKELNHSFATKSVEAVSYATEPRLQLTLSNGQQWNIDLRHPNRIACCQTDNTKNACVIFLNDTLFYEKLRNICFEHEKTVTPDVIIDNIVLCNGGIRNDIIEMIVPYSSDAK